jgi:type IV pilus assembly protein PilX
MMRFDIRTAHCAQRGAALVTALLLLLVITLLAVAGMNSSAVEFVLAGNEQFHQNAFQDAESGIQQTIATGAFVPAESDQSYSGTTAKYTVTLKSDMAGKQFPPIFGGSSFTTYHYTIVSTGTSSRGSSTIHTQGVAQIAQVSSSVDPKAGTKDLSMPPASGK